MPYNRKNHKGQSSHNTGLERGNVCGNLSRARWVSPGISSQHWQIETGTKQRHMTPRIWMGAVGRKRKCSEIPEDYLWGHIAATQSSWWQTIETKSEWLELKRNLTCCCQNEFSTVHCFFVSFPSDSKYQMGASNWLSWGRCSLPAWGSGRTSSQYHSVFCGGRGGTAFPQTLLCWVPQA